MKHVVIIGGGFGGLNAAKALRKATDTFLGSLPAPAPYVIGIAGSVAVGKSTFARILRALLSR